MHNQVCKIKSRSTVGVLSPKVNGHESPTRETSIRSVFSSGGQNNTSSAVRGDESDLQVSPPSEIHRDNRFHVLQKTHVARLIADTAVTKDLHFQTIGKMGPIQGNNLIQIEFWQSDNYLYPIRRISKNQ